MRIDVSSRIVIERPREMVAAYAANPDHAPEWYVNIESVEWKGPRPLRAGSQLDFVARFLGRRMAYTYEVVEHTPGERLVMRTRSGPFPMETTYEWETLPEGTGMTLRNRGAPDGIFSLLGPLMALAVRRATRKDLDQLKRILES